MNLLGKLFIVLIFIGCIGLTCFSVIVFSTHTNWKARTDELNTELQLRNKELAALKSQKETLEATLNLEKNRQRGRLITWQEKCEDLEDKNKEMETEIADLKVDVSEQVEAVRVAHETAESLRGRLADVEEALITAQTAWMSMSTELYQTMDEAHGLAIQVTTYRGISEKLAEDYGDAMEVLKIHGLLPEPALYNTTRPPAGIQGIITEIRGGLVEISIGSDSGLVKGHQLDVVRRNGSSYVGKIEIVSTIADKATAKILTDFRMNIVQIGDVVKNVKMTEIAVH